MKWIIVALVLLNITSTAFSAEIKKLVLKRPFVIASCKDKKFDRHGGFGLRTELVSAALVENVLEIEVLDKLLLCQLNLDEGSEGTFVWKEINPFEGYDVQYFDYGTSSFLYRREFIDPNSKFDRFTLGASLFENSKHLNTTLLVPSSDNNLLSGVLEININDLFDQNDLEKFKNKEEVLKSIVLFNNLTTSSYVRANLAAFNDLYFSGRVLQLTFAEEGSKYKLKKLSVK